MLAGAQGSSEIEYCSTWMKTIVNMLHGLNLMPAFFSLTAGMGANNSICTKDCEGLDLRQRMGSSVACNLFVVHYRG